MRSSSASSSTSSSSTASSLISLAASSRSSALARRALFVQVDCRRLAHRISEFAKLRGHFFHLLLEIALIDSAHLLRVFCMQQPLRKLEPRNDICFRERHSLVVHFLRSRIGRA